jgi:hypothetical protein
MEFYRFKQAYKELGFVDYGASFIYVISQYENKPPYKVGMTKYDIMRRMGNYQTAFINFYIYALVGVQYADVFAVERFLHNELSGRIHFPKHLHDAARTRQTPSPPGVGNPSEWFDTTERDLRHALRSLAREPKLNPTFALQITKTHIHEMKMLRQDKGDPDQEVDKAARTGKSRSGRVLRSARTGANLGHYHDNNRFWNVDYTMIDKKGSYPSLSDRVPRRAKAQRVKGAAREVIDLT